MILHLFDWSRRRRAGLFAALLLAVLVVAACNRGNVQEPAVVPAVPAEQESETAEETAEDTSEDAETTDASDNDDAAAEEASENAEIETAVEEAPEDAAESDTDVEAIAAEPAVFFLQPTDNAVVPITSTVKMSVTGLIVEPAGEVRDGFGHMHVLINAPFIEPGEVIPKDENHLHFGDGSTEAEVGLQPGLHTLRLQYADGAHLALEGDQYRDEIIVRAVEGAADQAVRFVTPTDGATVPPEFAVIMAASGLVVEPSGVIRDGAGHMHVLVDTDFIEPGQVIPKDETHLHFGGGQLEAMVALTPGEHVLRLQMADGAHFALEGDQYRDEIAVTVVEGAPADQVMFVAPADGDTIAETSTAKWGAAGLIIEPSGPVLRENGGHLHLIIDGDFIEAGQVVPKDETHIHFGGGQTETELTLTPGEHLLRLQMANGAHIALEGDQYLDEITVTVE